MPFGKVRWFNDQRGYGFLREEEDGPDFFIHQTRILMPGRRTLLAGQEVEFERIETSKGLQAVNVRPLGPAPGQAEAPPEPA